MKTFDLQLELKKIQKQGKKITICLAINSKTVMMMMMMMMMMMERVIRLPLYLIMHQTIKFCWNGSTPSCTNFGNWMDVEGVGFIF